MELSCRVAGVRIQCENAGNDREEREVQAHGEGALSPAISRMPISSHKCLGFEGLKRGKIHAQRQLPTENHLLKNISTLLMQIFGIDEYPMGVGCMTVKKRSAIR